MQKFVSNDPNNPKQLLNVRNSFKNRIFWKGVIKKSKNLNKVNFIFLSNPVPFNAQDYEKQKGSGTSDQPPYRL